MPDPSWDVEFSDEVKKVRDDYSQDLLRKGLVASLRRGVRVTAFGSIYDQQDAFKAFLREISKVGADPNALSKLPAAVADGQPIADCFLLDDDPWTAYLWRDTGESRTVVVLLYKEADREAMLKAFSLR